MAMPEKPTEFWHWRKSRPITKTRKRFYMTPSLYRICADGTIHPANEAVKSPTSYFVETLLIPARTTATGYEYYSCQLQDVKRQPIESNSFEFEGVRCRLEERDQWDTDNDRKREFGIDGIVLVCHITDLLGVERRVPFNNNRHDGTAWVELMAYLREVKLFGTHEAMKEVFQLRSELRKIRKHNEELREKVRKAETPS